MKAFFLSLTMLALVGCGGSGGTTTPTFNSSVMITNGIEGGVRGIYRISPDGSMTLRIATLASTSAYLTISPDRAKVCYSDGAILKIIGVDGSSPVTVPLFGGTGSDNFPSWNRDSQGVAFTHAPPSGIGQVRNWRMSDPTTTTLVSPTSGWPRCSPTEDKVVYCDFSPSSNGSLLRSGNYDGTGVATVATAPAGQSVQNPHISPNGARVVFTQVGTGNYLVSSLLNGTGSTTTSTLSYAPFYRVAIGADNETMYSTTFSGSGQYSLVRLNGSTGATSTVYAAPSGGLFNPALSPDGTQVALTGNSGLVIVNVSTGTAQTIGASISASYCDWK